MTESDDILATGTATATQLAKMFKRDKNSMGRLLRGLPPVTTRKGYPVYDIAEAAGMLVPIGYDVEERLRFMNQADLPPLLGKEFWNGQRSRKAYERESGDLWPTAEVAAVLARKDAIVVMQMKLLVDKIERQTAVTPRQREILRREADATVNAMREATVDAFAAYPVPNDNVSGALVEDDVRLLTTGKMDL